MPGSDRYDSAVLVGLGTVPASPLSTRDNAGTALTTPAVSRGHRRRKDVGELIKTQARAHLRWKEPRHSLSKLIRQLSLDGKEGKSGQDRAAATKAQREPSTPAQAGTHRRLHKSISAKKNCPEVGHRQQTPQPFSQPTVNYHKNIFVMRHPLLSPRLLRVMERFQSLEDKSQALGCLPGRIILHQVEFCSNYLQNSWTAG